MTPQTAAWIDADKRSLWHPFTQMQDWCAPDHEPLVLVSGNGAVVTDSEGRDYFDGNASIWTNLHGHRHPRLDRALADQLARVAHTSFLGATNPPAIRLAEALVDLFPSGDLSRVFFTDDGSTAVEVAIKMAAQFWQLTGHPERARFVAFDHAYHGDTMGASSLGGVRAFHGRFAPWQFPVERVESVADLPCGDRVAAVVIEPLVQGAAGIRLWPDGMLAELRAWCDRTGALLILDEVLTGFGRTGTMFACEQEGVVPDLIALAKGLSGGYLPLAATLCTGRIFEAFLGRYDELKALFYGHSFCGNALGCAVALENLAMFREENVLGRVNALAAELARLLDPLRSNAHVRAIRQRGLIAGIEIGRADGTPFDWREQTGARICAEARRFGLLTRPVRDVIVLIPPYCASPDQLRDAVAAIGKATAAVCG
jgi:adenosylmethionine-8-amino-7-oxononanoate aminotransferase